MENNYIVYIHIFPNNKVYIGITCKTPKQRWKNGKSYTNNKYMNNAIKKYGWESIEHKILYKNLTKEAAEQKEIELIAKYDSTNQSKGYNIDKGGNHQGKTSDITRERLSKSHLGHKLKDETKEKIKQTLKGTRHGNSILRMKPIDVYDENNNFIKHYDCMTDCQNGMGIKKQYISLCCQDKKIIDGYKFKISA